MRTAMILLLVGSLFAGCGRGTFPVRRTWLAAEEGIVFGDPTRTADGTVQLPLSLERRRSHTKEVFRSVKATVEERTVLLRIVGGPPGPKWPVWDGLPLVLGPLPSGTYEVLLVEPDKTRVPLAQIEVPKWTTR